MKRGMKQTPWSEQQKSDLVRLKRREHKSWAEISNIVGHTVNQCQSRYYLLIGPKREALSAEQKSARNDALILLKEIVRLREAEFMTWPQIAEKVGKTAFTVENRYRDRHIHLGEVQRFKTSPAAIAEREARALATHRKTLTQIILGDPPPGYSAADRRGA